MQFIGLCKFLSILKGVMLKNQLERKKNSVFYFLYLNCLQKHYLQCYRISSILSRTFVAIIVYLKIGCGLDSMALIFAKFYLSVRPGAHREAGNAAHGGQSSAGFCDSHVSICQRELRGRAGQHSSTSAFACATTI